MRWNAAVIVVVAFVVIAGAVLALRWRSGPGSIAMPSKPATAASAASTTVPSQEQIEAQIRREGATSETAKMLFSLVVGPLPGVSVPAGTVRDPSQFDGTFAVRDLIHVWGSLSAEQRQAATRLIGEPPSASGRRGEGDAVLLAAFMPANQPTFDYGTLLRNADGALGVLLNQPGIRYTYEVDYDPPVGTEFAHTSSWHQLPVSGNWVQNQGGSCDVRIHDQKFQPPVNDLDAQAVLTHEMFHCYQQRVLADFADFTTVSRWIGEGEAMWAMAAVVPGGFGVIAKDWNQYVNSPTELYSARGQDGIGVFGHLSDITGDEAVWPRLLPAVKLSVGLNEQGAFDYLIQGNEDAYFSSWGSSYFLTAGKVPWTMTGPGHPPASGYAAGTVTVDGGTNTIVGPVPSYEARIVKLSGNADVVLVGLLTGYGRLHDQPFGIDTRLDSSGSLALCVKSGGCACPDGSPGASLVTKPATAPLSVGLDGGDSSAQLLVIGKSMEDYCKQPDKQPAPPNPGGGGGGGGGTPPDPDAPPHDGGSTFGDTHIATFDGRRYDFQVVGEYTLVRSTKDDFAVQVRQVPALQSRTVTVNQAMATKIGSKRVSVSLENGAPVLRLDGQVVTGEIPKLVGGSISRAMTMYGTSYLFEWPDGTTLRVEQLGPRVLNVRVQPAEPRRGALAGLLGDADGSPANDLVDAKGAPIATQASPEDAARTLADAWRVTQASSLFDYLPGQSTATFTDPTFPEYFVDPSRVANRAQAEKNCRESGITDQHLLDDCILDFAVTSDFLFTSSYSHAQQVAAAHALIASASAGVLRTVMMTGSISDPKSRPSFEFKAQAGDILWLGAPDCTDNYAGIGLVDPSGRGLPGAWPCSIGRLTLPATGTYTFRVYKSAMPLGAYHVPIRFIRPDRRREASYGDIISGRIETAGAHDLYSFAAHGGDVLRLAGEGCSLGNLIVGLLDPEGHDSLGPSCRSGSDARLTKTGTYQLVINAADGASGPYHFVLQGAASQAK